MDRKTISFDDPIPPHLESELLALIAEGRTVSAIKLLRTATNASLSECIKWVEERIRRLDGIQRRSNGPPCPYCGKALRTDKARQCFECGVDWHKSSS
jgi:hypothetical protein